MECDFIPAMALRNEIDVGHTDGYPAAAAGTYKVLINGRLYPVVTGGVASAYSLPF